MLRRVDVNRDSMRLLFSLPLFRETLALSSKHVVLDGAHAAASHCALHSSLHWASGVVDMEALCVSRCALLAERAIRSVVPRIRIGDAGSMGRGAFARDRVNRGVVLGKYKGEVGACAVYGSRGPSLNTSRS